MKRFAALMLFVVFILLFNSSAHAVPAYYTFEGTVTDVVNSDNSFKSGDSVRYVFSIDNVPFSHSNNITMDKKHYSYSWSGYYYVDYIYDQTTVTDLFNIEYIGGDFINGILPLNPSHPLPNDLPDLGDSISAVQNYTRTTKYSAVKHTSSFWGFHSTYYTKGNFLSDNINIDMDIELIKSLGTLEINKQHSESNTSSLFPNDYKTDYLFPSNWTIGDSFTGHQKYYWLNWIAPYTVTDTKNCITYESSYYDPLNGYVTDSENCSDELSYYQSQGYTCNFIESPVAYSSAYSEYFSSGYYECTKPVQMGNKWDTVLAELTLDLTLTDISDTNPFQSQNTSSGNNSAPVPEPSTLLLLASGIAGVSFLKRRK